MCGIAGYAGLHWPEILEPMSAATVHRGPDDGGVWHDAEALVGLAYRRLSIIDLSSAGHQPMCNGDRTVWISYNGEIYNFPEHRERLLEKDYRFRSHTDTEVIIALYEELGLDFLGELNGIFAFALWDAKSRRLLLARDHAGVKPLYYRSAGRKLYFASEIKALLSIPGFPRELHLPSVADYLTFLWVPGENTLLAAHNFLYTDKSSMAVSIEARVPFMDVELMRLCARIPERYKLHGGVTKYVLKKAMERHLPKDLVHRKKTGFGAPLRKWLHDDLNEVVQYLLGPGHLEARALFDAAVVQRVLSENASGKADHAYLIYALLTLEIWMQTFLDRPGAEVTL